MLDASTIRRREAQRATYAALTPQQRAAKSKAAAEARARRLAVMTPVELAEYREGEAQRMRITRERKREARPSRK